jgi:hypothetical protein
MPDDVPRDMRHLCKQFPGRRTFIPSNPREGRRCSLYAASERPRPHCDQRRLLLRCNEPDGPEVHRPGPVNGAGDRGGAGEEMGTVTRRAEHGDNGSRTPCPGERNTVTWGAEHCDRGIPPADGTATGRRGQRGVGRARPGQEPGEFRRLAGDARRARRPGAPRPGLGGGLPDGDCPEQLGAEQLGRRELGRVPAGPALTAPGADSTGRSVST